MAILFNFIRLSNYITKPKLKLGTKAMSTSCQRFTLKTKRGCNPNFGQRKDSEVIVYVSPERVRQDLFCSLNL